MGTNELVNSFSVDAKMQRNTTYLLTAKEFGRTYLQMIIGFPENSEFYVGINLWEKNNADLLTQKVQLHVLLLGYVPRITPKDPTP